jgi:hypothetical protein
VSEAGENDKFCDIHQIRILHAQCIYVFPLILGINEDLIDKFELCY